MLRIFQTGDNHIGLKYASHEKAEVLRTARIKAFENMVSIANKEKCNLFVITGDLFENTYSISRREVETLLNMLTCFKGTVVVLPGNHDYYDKDVKVWQYFHDIASGKDNILLLTQYRPYVLSVQESEVVIYPAHCTSVHSEPGKNNLNWIKQENIISDESYRIGIAHGAVEGETIDKEGMYFMMTASELEGIPMDVWLIGHTHVPFPNNLTDKLSVTSKILNAGTHVQTDVSCNTEGSCFIVELDESKTVRAKKVQTGSLRFYRKYITLAAGEMEAVLERELSAIDDNSVVELILSGAVDIDEYDNRGILIENSISRFVEGTYNDSSLSKLISKELIDAEFAETSFSAGFLTALLREPKEAQLAYELLRTLKEER